MSKPWSVRKYSGTLTISREWAEELGYRILPDDPIRRAAALASDVAAEWDTRIPAWPTLGSGRPVARSRRRRKGRAQEDGSQV